MGCARDIVEYCGVPRFLFSDFPLGNPAGKPFDRDSQALTLELALRLFENATEGRTTSTSPLNWSDDPSWKRDYSSVDGLTDADILRLRSEFDASKEVKQAMRAQRHPTART